MGICNMHPKLQHFIVTLLFIAISTWHQDVFIITHVGEKRGEKESNEQ